MMPNRFEKMYLFRTVICRQIYRKIRAYDMCRQPLSYSLVTRITEIYKYETVKNWLV